MKNETCPYCNTTLPLENDTDCKIFNWHLADHPTDTPNGVPEAYIGGVNFDPDIQPKNLKIIQDILAVNDEDDTTSISGKQAHKYLAIINGLLATQKAEIISLVMDMILSGEVDDVAGAKIINKIRGIK